MFLNALKFVFICLEVVIFFNLMIIVHELGHFLAARWRGLVIERFGIWFGKPLWEKEIGGVIYSLGSIPAGGFVALPQLAPMEVMEGKVETPREQLPPISALDKIIVAFAGPLFSFLLAIVFAVVVWQVGRPVTEGERTTMVGNVAEDSPAAKAGIKVGDKILEVDGKPVTRFQGMSEDSITWRIVRSEGETIPIKLQRGDEIIEVAPKPVIPKKRLWSRSGLRQIQVEPAQTPMVAEVKKDSPADKAGFKPNDLLVEINGERFYTESRLVDFGINYPDADMVFTVKRGEELLKLPLATEGAKVQAVLPGSPADQAGIKAGDLIVAVDGKARFPWQIMGYVKKQGLQPLKVTVKTGTAQRELTITPQIPEADKDDKDPIKNPMLGLVWDLTNLDGISLDRFGKFDLIWPGPVEQIRAGFMSIVNTVGAIFSKKSDVKVQHMGGPVMMMRIYYVMFESSEGWRLALWFSVVLNVNLALLNMLPIPVLDGGHITLAVLEAVRRKPVNVRVLEYIQSTCAIVIIGFMIFIAVFDVQDLFGLGGKRDTLKFKTVAPAEAAK